MKSKILIFAIFVISACTTAQHHNLKNNQIEILSKNFIKKINYLTNTKYGELIIKYDLLSIDKHTSCFLSPMFFKVFHPNHHNENIYKKYLAGLEKKIEYKISSDSWLFLIHKNIEHKIDELDHIEILNINNNNYKQNNPFDIIEKKISFALMEKDLKKFADKDHKLQKLPILPPIYNYSITSNFSLRKDPFTKKLRKHLGIDLKSEDNSVIYASAEGIVEFAGKKGNYGNIVIINHGNNYNTRYAHLNKIYVNIGDKVLAHQKIAIQGCTGKCTGDHLHYEIRKNGEALNPQKFLNVSKLCIHNR